MKRVLSLVALLGLAALPFVGARWLLNSDPGAANAARPGAERETAPASAAAVELDALADPADAGEVQPDALAGRRESEVRTSASAAKPARAERSVTVLDASTRQPLAGVDVRYDVLAVDQLHFQHPAWSGNTLASWLSTGAAATKSDDEGSARLDTTPGRACVVIGRAEGLIGRAYFAAGEEGVKPLELATDAHVEVLALGPDGRPLAGLSIALRNRIQGHITDPRVRTTDSDGRTRFEHVGLDVAFDARDLAWSLAIVGLLDERAEFALDPKAWPRETVELHACPSGEVELSAFDLHGAPMPNGHATLSVAQGDEQRVSFWASREETHSEIANGRAHFPHVRLGASLVARVTPRGASTPIEKKFDGPRAAGEVVRVEVRAGVLEPVLRARLFDEAGPLANKSIDWSLRRSSNWSLTRSDGSVSTDSEGVALVSLPEFWTSGTKRTFLFQMTGDGPVRRARLDLSRELEPGVHDFGDLRLEPLPELASGRVVDADGKPIAQVRVAASAERADDPTWSSGSGELDAVTDAKGEFVVRGDIQGSRLTLSAATKTARSAEIECAVGARDVRLTLLEGGRIEGGLLLDPGVPTSSLYISVDREDNEPDSENRDKQASLSDDGRFEALQLDPGRYRLRVQTANTQEVLAEIGGLHVPAGGACDDARLASIDLRGLLTAIRIEMVPPLPHERVTGQVFATPLDKPDAPVSLMFHDRTVALCVAGRGADLVIAAAGYKVVSIPAADGDVKIQLERGPKVRLRLPRDFELPKRPRHLKATLRREGMKDSLLGHFQDGAFDASGELVLYAPGVGEFEIEWVLERRTESSLSTRSVAVATPQRIEVLDLAGEQLFELSAPGPEVAKALESW